MKFGALRMADRLINVIFAVGPNGEFGHANGDLPWRHIKEDMQHFKQTTEGTSVICGRKTWETIGNLPNRETIVVSSLLNGDDPIVARSLDEAISWAAPKRAIWVIGGISLIEEALRKASIVSASFINGHALIPVEVSDNYMQYFPKESLDYIEENFNCFSRVAHPYCLIKSYIRKRP